MIELIKDVSEIEGTCYFEFLPGIYKDECWNEESVYIDYLQIYYIEPILAKHINGYDHYSFMSADKTTWLDIIKDLIQTKEVLRKAQDFDELTSSLSFPFRDIENNFIDSFEESRVELMKMIDDFVLWVRETLKTHNKIAVLGM